MDGTAKPSIWNRVFISLLIINFFNSMGQMMMNTLIPLYAYGMGATATTVGIVTSAFAKGAIVPAIISSVLFLAAACVGSFIAIYAGLLGIENIGFYFTAYAVTMLATRPLYGSLADRFGFHRVILPGLCMFAAAFVIIWQARTLPMFILAGIVNGFGFGAVIPLIQALAVQCVPESRRGSASNTYYIGIDLGLLLGPSLGGLVVDAFLDAGAAPVAAYGDLYLVELIPIALGAVLYLASRTHLQNLRQRSEVENATTREVAAE